MAVPHLLDEAVGRLEDASRRIDACRESATELESLRTWVEALTDYVRALAEVHEYTNESVHEKLHELAKRTGHEEVVKAGPADHVEPHPYSP